MSDSVEQHDDIQALFRGFGTRWPWAMFAYCTLGADPELNRSFLKTLPRALGSGDGPTAVAELDKKRYVDAFDAAFNVAFTYRGLSKLGIAPDVLSSFPSEFIQGMRKRAGIIHDYGRSAPKHWEDHWKHASVDIWIGIYARTEAVRERQRQRLAAHLHGFGVRIEGFDLPRQITADDIPVWIDDPKSQPGAAHPIEHFGFGDGISNPPIKGLGGSGSTNSGGKIDATGKWRPIAAGEFLYGHIDEIGEVPAGPATTGIGGNGSYLVLRKLSQDVDAFRSYVSERARLHGMGADELAAKLIGRTRKAAPLVPRRKDDRNDFTYSGDMSGTVCPWGSHARRMNPRDGLGFQTLLVDRHRILRRGIPYGQLVPQGRRMSEINPLDRVEGAGKYPGQGLMFLALNVDIRRQFEFVQSEWANFGNDLHQGSDRDPIIGARDPKRPENNRLIIPTDSVDGVVLCPEIPSFVETRGGDYFFLPGLHVYGAIAKGQYH